MIFSQSGDYLQVSALDPPATALHSSNRDCGAAIAGGPLVTIGLFIFAWTCYPWVHWIAPIIGSALFGAG